MATLHEPSRETASPSPPLRTASGQPVSVVHVTAEFYPFARTGGLAEAVSGLANFQRAAGLNVAAILPLYRTVRDVDPDLEPVGQPFMVPLGSHSEEARVFRVAGPSTGPQVFFIEHLDYFKRHRLSRQRPSLRLFRARRGNRAAAPGPGSGIAPRP